MLKLQNMTDPCRRSRSDSRPVATKLIRHSWVFDSECAPPQQHRHHIWVFDPEVQATLTRKPQKGFLSLLHANRKIGLILVFTTIAFLALVGIASPHGSRRRLGKVKKGSFKVNSPNAAMNDDYTGWYLGTGQDNADVPDWFGFDADIAKKCYDNLCFLNPYYQKGNMLMFYVHLEKRWLLVDTNKTNLTYLDGPIYITTTQTGHNIKEFSEKMIWKELNHTEKLSFRNKRNLDECIKAALVEGRKVAQRAAEIASTSTTSTWSAGDLSSKCKHRWTCPTWDDTHNGKSGW